MIQAVVYYRKPPLHAYVFPCSAMWLLVAVLGKILDHAPVQILPAILVFLQIFCCFITFESLLKRGIPMGLLQPVLTVVGILVAFIIDVFRDLEPGWTWLAFYFFGTALLTIQGIFYRNVPHLDHFKMD